MHLSYALQALVERLTPTSDADTRLRGRWLVLARLAWAALAGLVLLLFVLGIPARYDHLRTLSGDDALGAGWTPAAIRAALAQLGLSTDFRAIYFIALAVLVALGSFTVAVVLLWRKSGDGLALFVSLFLLTLGLWPTGIIPALVVSHPAWQVPWQFVQAFVLIAFLWFCLLFPDGRLVPRWSRLPALVWGLLLLAGSLTLHFNGPVQQFGQLLWMVGWGAGVLAQVYRYRRVSGPVQRQQTKWVVFGVTGVVLALLTFLVLLPALTPALYQPTPLGVLFEMIGGAVLFSAFLLIPLSIGIALLRYRLWDVDLLINRSLVYGLLSASVIGSYALLVGGLGAVFQHQANVIISLFATGLVAVLFQPLRERLQRGVNRLLYGQRDEPYQVLARLGRQLEATLAPEAVLPAIVKTIAQALKLPYLAVSVKQGDEFKIAAAAGEPEDSPLSLPLTYQGEVIGQVRLAPRHPGEPLTPPVRRLLEDLLPQIGLAVHAVRLTADVQRSRERLVTAREEERRRLRRDLHDGIGPTLASLAHRLDTVARLVPRTPDVAITELGHLKGQVKTTIAEIRRLVYALRPPVLDELGLLSALREHLAQLDQPDGLHLTLEAPEALPELPAAVEVAVYRIVLEALTNVVRHAHASTCLIHLELDDAGNVYLSITDDGIGLPANLQAGVGITSMRERAAELGGTCQITARSPQGTRVDVRLPLAKE